MKKINKLSIFVGKFESETSLNTFIQEHFTEDGDASSELMSELNVDFIDNQFQEVLFIGREIVKSDFNEFSYSENFADKISDDFLGYNSLILLYDFSFDTARQLSIIKFLNEFDYR